MEIKLRFKKKGDIHIQELTFSDYCPFGFWMAQNCEEIEVVECVQEDEL